MVYNADVTDSDSEFSVTCDEFEQQLELVTAFGIEGILQSFVGSKPPPKINWRQVRKQSVAAPAANRYPVRAGRNKRDHGEMVELRSADCSDASEQEEEEEPDEMIDDVDTAEEFAEAARKAARKERKAAKRARKAAKKAAKEVVDLTVDSE